MGVGIALGNTVDSVGPALQKGEFVGVSIPIGTCHAQISSSSC
jgi:ACR3 family arsenite transporter